MSHRRLRLEICLAAILAFHATASLAGQADIPVPDEELAEARGGFISAGGVSFDFGATLSTVVDGQLALQTVLVYQPGGVTSVTTAAAGVAPISTAALSQMSGQGAAIAPGALPTYGVAGGGVSLVQGATPTGIVNVALNTGAGQTVSQSTALTLTIANGAAFQASGLLHSVFNDLSQQIALGALAGRH